jgi:hypothetical protein
MNTQHQLAAQLRILKLGGFLETLDVRLKQAREEEILHVEFFCKWRGIGSQRGGAKGSQSIA